MALILFLLTWLWLGIAAAQPVVDNACQCFSNNNGTCNFSCTASGTNRLAVVGLHWSDQTSTVSTLTYGGLPMTLHGTATGAGGVINSALYRLTDPPTGTQTVSVIMTNFPDMGVGGVLFTNVDQTTPMDAAVTASGTTQTTATVDVSSASTKLVVDAVSWCCSDCAPTGFGLGAGQTSQVRIEPVDGFELGPVGMSTEVGAGTTTMSWTCAAMEDWAMVAASVNQAAAPDTLRRRGLTYAY